MGIVEFYAKIFKPLRMKSLKSEQRSNLSDLHSGCAKASTRRGPLCAPNRPQASLAADSDRFQGSAHLQLESADIGQRGMRDWDGANRQCAERGDSRQRQGNGHQGAA